MFVYTGVDNKSYSMKFSTGCVSFEALTFTFTGFSPTAFTLGVLIESCSRSVVPARRFPQQISHLSWQPVREHARACPSMPEHARACPAASANCLRLAWVPWSHRVPPPNLHRKFTYQIYIPNLHTKFTYQIYIPNLHTKLTYKINIPNLHTQFTYQTYVPSLHTKFTHQINIPKCTY